VEAEELGVSLGILYCNTSWTHWLFFLCPQASFPSRTMIWISCVRFGMKTRINLTASTFYEMSYNFSKAGMENLAPRRDPMSGGALPLLSP
jgi:hypothetical protein